MSKLQKPFIQIKNLSFSYPNLKNQETQALKNISFDIKEGEFVAIVGPSGCGKTTLLNCIDGLIKPTLGEILINGKKILAPGSDRAFVFQDPLLLPWRNVLGNIGFGLEMQGQDKQIIAKRSQELVDLMHLKGFEKFYPSQLSGGMKQRVNIARALCARPSILLLDEPFSNLDAQIREIMQEEILNIYDKYKKTFIFITHSIEEAVFLADRIIVLSKRPGTIKQEFNVSFKRPRNLAIKDSKEFIKIKKQITEIIKNEVYV